MTDQRCKATSKRGSKCLLKKDHEGNHKAPARMGGFPALDTGEQWKQTGKVTLHKGKKKRGSD
jgi:hypothetical protein